VQWDTGDSVATAYGGIVSMYECRNVAQLAAFIEDLAAPPGAQHR
jgi:hypothetical protein